jgi:23S rRNA (guanosine2251-2'-O)-methyltransferase
MTRKLNSKQLRKTKPGLKNDLNCYTNPIVFVLDNVTDTFNIGSFFRLADAIGAKCVYLCGKTVAPPNIKIHRASVGLWRWVPWQQHQSTERLVKKLKKNGYQIIASELTDKSKNYLKLKPKFPVAIVVGHETTGVSENVVKLADYQLEIPMLGVNKSLNVLVAASVMAYRMVSFL